MKKINKLIVKLIDKYPNTTLTLITTTTGSTVYYNRDKFDKALDFYCGNVAKFIQKYISK